MKQSEEIQILSQAHRIWPEETFPQFQVDKSNTVIIDYQGGSSSYGDTLTEALYACARQSRTAMINDYGEGQKWDAVIELLSEYVSDPIGEIEKEVEEINLED